MRIDFNQGDIYWIDLTDPVGSGPGFRHPHIVIQNDIFNQSKINTTVVCVLSSNLKRAAIPGNVLLPKKNTGLAKDSVAIVTQIVTVDKSQLGDFVGRATRAQLKKILDGVLLMLQPS